MSHAVYIEHEARQLDELIRRTRRQHDNRTQQEARRVTAAALRRWMATGVTLRVTQPNENRR
jgi:2-keto-4-pentenoate hydratase